MIPTATMCSPRRAGKNREYNFIYLYTYEISYDFCAVFFLYTEALVVCARACGAFGAEGEYRAYWALFPNFVFFFYTSGL